jgi:hypothetical protein
MITPRPCAIIVGSAYLDMSHAPLEARVERRVPLLLGAVDRVVRVVDAGVVEEDVEAAAEGAQRLLGRSAAVVGDPGVGADEDGPAARRLDRSRDLPASRLVPPGQRDARALRGEEPRRRLADARRGAVTIATRSFSFTLAGFRA